MGIVFEGSGGRSYIIIRCTKCARDS